MLENTLYHLSRRMHKIYPLLKETDFPPISRKNLQTIQVNLGYKCNQRCLHCHVNAGPNRKEMMDKKTVDEVIQFIIKNKVTTVDLTGGAPEMNNYFKYMIENLSRNRIRIIDRCNLTILLEKNFSGLDAFLAKHKVEIVASLPCYMEDNVDNQRGKGVFKKSIEAIKILNDHGYAKSKDLILNLVYNPQDDKLPPNQKKLENDYKLYLYDKYNIQFNNLYTIANMPINRFGSQLISHNRFKSYMKLLKNSFSKSAYNKVMCRSLISIDYKVYVYYCDFNQLLVIP